MLAKSPIMLMYVWLVSVCPHTRDLDITVTNASLLTILLSLSHRLISVLVQYCVLLDPVTFVCSCVHFWFMSV